MNLEKQKTSHSGLLYAILVIVSVLTIGYLTTFDKSNQQIHEQISQQLSNIKPIEVAIDGSQRKIYITDQSFFTDTGIWTYVGPKNNYPVGYKPDNLVDVPVDHSADEDMKLSVKAVEPLKELFVAADEAGYPLIVASAYRSIDEQTKLQREFTNRMGPQMAARYVADPGSSEHHSGLAVDIDDYSADCAVDSNVCYLSLESGNWLAENAYKYGFILRYPEGKQPITDMAYESWHYRYVGVPLATALTEADLTFDEFITIAAPGRLN